MNTSEITTTPRPMKFSDIRTALETKHAIAQQTYMLAMQDSWESKGTMNRVAAIMRAREAQKAAVEAKDAYVACLEVESQLCEASLQEAESNLDGCYKATAKAADQFNIVIKGMEYVDSYLGSPNTYLRQAIEIEIRPADKKAIMEKLKAESVPTASWKERLIENFKDFTQGLKFIRDVIEMHVLDLKEAVRSEVQNRRDLKAKYAEMDKHAPAEPGPITQWVSKMMSSTKLIAEPLKQLYKDNQPSIGAKMQAIKEAAEKAPGIAQNLAQKAIPTLFNALNTQEVAAARQSRISVERIEPQFYAESFESRPRMTG